VNDELRFVLWRPRDRRYVWAIPLLSALLVVVVVVLFVWNSPVRVDGDSMYPALHHNDRVLLSRGADSFARGDIISVRVGDASNRSRVLKRVIAIEGDTVEMVGDQAFVNGSLSAAAPDAIIEDLSYRYGPGTVPAGSLFVLGDNRPNSLDSRVFGFVPEPAVAGRVTAIIWPPARIRGVDPADTAE
jgi:signal peptidase I